MHLMFKCFQGFKGTVTHSQSGLNYRINAIIVRRFAASEEVAGGRISHCDIISVFIFLYFSRGYVFIFRVNIGGRIC